MGATGRVEKAVTAIHADFGHGNAGNDLPDARKTGRQARRVLSGRTGKARKGGGDSGRYQRSRYRPRNAPTAPTISIASPYQVRKNSGASSLQCSA